LCTAASAGATPIVNFDFDDGSGGFLNAAALVAPGLSASAWSDLDGTLTSFTGNPGRALAAKSWNDGNALSFTLSAPPGLSWRFDDFSFDQRASSTGPLDWTLKMGGIVTANGSTTQGFTTVFGPGGLSGLAGDVLIELEAGGAPSATGTWRIDNFSLNGTIMQVPEPATLLMLTTGLIVLYGLSGMRRRRLNAP